MTLDFLNKLTTLESLQSNIETLKDLLKRSGMASSLGREDLCTSIEISSNFYPRNLMLESDDIYINSLFTYLQDTKKLKSFHLLCHKLEPHFQGSVDEAELRNIQQRFQRKISILKLYDILNQPMFEQQFNQDYICAYQQCLLHKEIKLNNDLDELKDDNNNAFSLFDCFVGYLKLNIEKKSLQLDKLLDKWIDSYQPNWNDLLNVIIQKNLELDKKRRNSQPYLLVAVFDRNGALTVQGWVVSSESYCNPLNEQELSLELENFPQVFRNIYSDSIRYCQNNKLNYPKRIKVFLPCKYIDDKIISIDELPVNETNPPYIPADTFGKEYEIILEFSERTLANHQVVKWEKKRKSFVSVTTQDIFLPIVIPADVTQSQLGDLYKKLDSDSVLGTRFINTNNITNILEILYYAGIPFALWVRKNIPEIAETIQSELDNLCQCNCLAELSSNIQQQRYTAWEQSNNNHIGNHLSLMCDIDNLLPPRTKLSMP